MATRKILTTGEYATYLTVTDNGADWTTLPIGCGGARAISIQVNISSAAAGDLYVQVSNNDSNWINLSFEDETGALVTKFAKAAGTAMSKMIFIKDPSWVLMRFFWDHTTNGVITLRPTIRNHK